MGWLKAFLAGLGAALSALGAWWQKQQRDKALSDAQADADRIAAHPADEWVRRFGTGRASAAPTDAGKPGADE